MTKGRLEAFSDGVVAILITIMVLELRTPAGATWDALLRRGLNDAPSPLATLLTYVLSFVSLAIYWNNHHHMLHASTRVNGAVLWANTHLLFWLSLIPYTTNWMQDTHFAPVPTAAYGVVLLLSGVAFTILRNTLLAASGPDSTLAKAASETDTRKAKVSMALYAAAIPLAFLHPIITLTLIVIVAVMWLVPSRPIEEQLTTDN